jgi:hypothetical protein
MRRALARVAIGLVPVTAVAIACSFPDVTFSNSEAGAPGQDANSGTDGGPFVDDGGGPIIRDAAINEASTRSDAQQVIEDASVCATHTKCDCDEDGYAVIGCQEDLATIRRRDDAGTLQPGDCDDFDPLRNPGQTDFLKISPVKHAGDWNCNNTVERQIDVGFTCSGSAVLGCSDPGFKGVPPCGSQPTYYSCRANGLGCTEFDEGPRDVYCR